MPLTTRQAKYIAHDLTLQHVGWGTVLCQYWAEQQAAQERIAKLERQKTRQRREIYDVEDDIDAKRNQLIDQLTQRMTQHVSKQNLFTITWTVC